MKLEDLTATERAALTQVLCVFHELYENSKQNVTFDKALTKLACSLIGFAKEKSEKHEEMTF